MNWVKNAAIALGIFVTGYVAGDIDLSHKRDYDKFFVSANYFNQDENGNPQINAGIWHDGYSILHVKDMNRICDVKKEMYDKLANEFYDAQDLYNLSRERNVVDSSAIKNLELAEKKFSYDTLNVLLESKLKEKKLVTGGNFSTDVRSGIVDVYFDLK
ncbi:hypothetical protein K9L97_04650 [Candidatus Woesearchaeota archaeon]|nr:hypothetical protein [Candidatus Woesearchaeota archaeon]